MANAFYSLYSHVSRTPLQKLAPPQLTLSSPLAERTGSRTSVRSEPRSPVERLKDTISKMCLYTSSRGSESASPSGSPRKRRCRETWNAEDQIPMPGLQMEDDLEPDMDWFVDVGDKLEEMVDAEKVVEGRQTLEDSTPEHPPRTNQESKGSSSVNSTTVTMEPVPLITHDVICPQVIEYVKQAPYRSLETNSTDVKVSPFARPSIGRSLTSPRDQAGELSSRHTFDLCQITITGSEGDAAISDRDAHGPCSANIQKYLSPVKPLNLSRLIQSQSSKGNSFELEEVFDLILMRFI